MFHFFNNELEKFTKHILDTLKEENQLLLGIERDKTGALFYCYLEFYPDTLDIICNNLKEKKLIHILGRLDFYNNTYYYLIEDIRQSNDNVSKGYGAYCINKIKTLCRIFKIKGIRGFISDEDEDHYDRLNYFYFKKNGFKEDNPCNEKSKKYFLWKVEDNYPPK